LQITEDELLAPWKHKLSKKTYREFEEILVIEFISVTGGVFAGALLAHFLDKLALIPGLLILMPGFLAMRGNISGAMAARLSTALHLGLVLHDKDRHVLRSNTWAAFALGVLASVFLGIVAYLGTLLFFRMQSPDIILVAFIAGIISNLIMIPLTSWTTLWLFRHGHDPDNIMGPYITTVGDIVSVISLIIAVVIA